MARAKIILAALMMHLAGCEGSGAESGSQGGSGGSIPTGPNVIVEGCPDSLDGFSKICRYGCSEYNRLRCDELTSSLEGSGGEGFGGEQSAGGVGGAR